MMKFLFLQGNDTRNEICAFLKNQEEKWVLSYRIAECYEGRKT